MTDSEIISLVNNCSINNEARGITGLLLFSGGHFMQVLEGEGLRVSSLYAQICQDLRHTNAQRLLYKQAENRLFPAWGMNLVNTNQSTPLDRERINKTLLRLRLSKDENRSNEALTLLDEFRRQFTANAA